MDLAGVVKRAPKRRPPPAGGGRAPGAAPPDLGSSAPGRAPPKGPPKPGELLLRDVPATLSPAEQRRVAAVKGRAEHKQKAQAEMPPAHEQVAGAREAEKAPVEERQAESDKKLVKLLGQTPKPTPFIEKLAEQIRDVLIHGRAEDEDAVSKETVDRATADASAQAKTSVEGAVDKVDESYSPIERRGAPSPAETPPDVPPIPGAQPTPGLQATTAVPDGLKPADVSLDADLAANQKQFDEAGLNTESAQLVKEGPIAEARDNLGQLAENAKQDPGKLLAAQRAEREKARDDVLALQQSAVAALTSSRDRTAGSSRKHQHQLVGNEEQRRGKAMEEANKAFTGAQTQVKTLLGPLVETVMKDWTGTLKQLSDDYGKALDAVEKDLKERHSGVGGFFVGLADDVTGLPEWIVRKYEKAEQDFAEGAIRKAKELDATVNAVIASCMKLIDDAEAEIARVFREMGPGNDAWAAEQQKIFQGRLEGLRESARNTRAEFEKQLTQSALDVARDAHDKLHEMLERNKGIVGKIASAIGAFLKDPIRFLINGLLSLVGISPSSFWNIIDKIKRVISDIAWHPLRFAGHLLSAIGQGFDLFFSKIGENLLKGLLDWLFSGLKGAGVEIPKDRSLKSILAFILSMMGLGWDLVRRVIAKHVGERNVAMIEQVWTYVATLAKDGISGLVELVRQQLDPRSIIDQILTAARDAIVNSVITAVAKRILMLFNPVGAILAAIEAIYRVVKWVFQNAARIWTLIETIVNGLADLVAGNVGAMAMAVNNALIRLIPAVIGFLADYAGFGDLPDRIAGLIKGLRDVVERALDVVVGFLVGKAKALFGVVKGAAGRAVSWWKTRKKLQGEDGETHTLSFRGEGMSAQLMIASKPQTLSEFIAGKRPRSKEEKEAKEKAAQLAKELEKIVNSATAEGKLNEKDKANFIKKLDALAEATAILFGKAVPPASPPVFGGLSPAGYATKMTIERLTRVGPPGSRPSPPEIEHFEALNRRRTESGAAYYVKGHLLNHNLPYGTGKEWKNLTPLTRKANSDHHAKAEDKIKTKVKAGHVLKYVVKPDYDRKLNSMAHNPNVPDNVKKILAEEKFIPSQLNVMVSEVYPEDWPNDNWPPIAPIRNEPEETARSDYHVKKD